MRPGELSLAHRGILFVDEVAEFARDTLDTLRQPLEDKIVTISRAHGSVSYPCNIMFVAAMNPCKCGYYKDPDKQCICGINSIKQYQARVSGPMLDRIDMILEIPREKIDNILDVGPGESSESMRERVMKARRRQEARFAGTDIVTNANMSSKDIDTYISLSE